MSIPRGTLIAVAVSGGRDSLLALALLQEQGHEVVAVHARFLPGKWDEERLGKPLRDISAQLGVELRVLDLRAEFEQRVVAPFVAEYQAGRTPNPCALCNPRLKFGLLFERAAEEFGAGAIATGHYARLEHDPAYGLCLCRGEDATKDQSYFLALVPRHRLERAVFPLGGWRKADVATALEARGLQPPLPLESQEVCFIANDDYKAFLQARGVELPGPGPMEMEDGTVVGRHEGLWRYTLGQRRGLGIAWSEPLYVLDKDVRRNALLVGPKSGLASTGCEVRDVNYLVPPAQWPEVVLVKTRYRQGAAPALTQRTETGLAFEFLEPQERPAPGQVAVTYDEAGIVLAGAIIERGLWMA
ncbi:tRNA 2-thiouridine(34) synthase MnmA [Desulfocurvibacter africanus]|uniref:tRNA-specific 2-thiouridylase MnmA n=1 Tax=Desulfocurvibacter africanus subsp. africanus str. Walvis Bay TaxID=690850 RepID=F3Z400_DESAF|nr:tRNA 2-thiouridine(34) synthase MnmA [Desulfocurvibacter africanus]EGJ50452.1 tRNA-specific 2-thiouridylase mnmA [Desulfocurvibacter africanus subsp. africanus str. Walvis Bay]